jgi:hypothetical protein
LKRKVAGRGRGILVVARPRDPKEVSHVPTRLIDIYGPGGRESKRKSGVEEEEFEGKPGDGGRAEDKGGERVLDRRLFRFVGHLGGLVGLG